MIQADAWNPGLKSDIPTRLWPLVTLFSDNNAFVSYKEASELADLTGLHVLELYSLRPERLLTHSLLVRVTAELSVQDGPNYEELGINLRGMVETIHLKHLLPHVEIIAAEHEAVRVKAQAYIAEQLTLQFTLSTNVPSDDTAKPSLFKRWFGSASTSEEKSVIQESVEIGAIERWQLELKEGTTGIGRTSDTGRMVDADHALHQECLKALIKTVGAITGHRGRMLPDYSLVTRIVANQVCNTHGYEVINNFIEHMWSSAVAAEGYRLLPIQAKPVIMNVKGASASGKSTIRPQQRQLSEKLGIPWEDFALISPDYWRKYLLEYASLEDDYKYGAMLTGRELEIVDKKLDRYMAAKASSATLSHLLIDRFRFDSFIVDVDGKTDSKLLTRFGDQVYLFFMVTHPAETVSRAFERGKKTGRYKAVDDLLHHNVEAFTGMPSLFLSWVNSRGKRIHFEFLDNDVPLGDLPLTAAFGWNETLVILDVKLLLNIDRYKKVNIAATTPDEIFTQADLDAQKNTDFIVQCANTVNKIVFADQHTAEQYATLTGGTLDWWDADYIEQHASVEGLHDILKALGYTGEPCSQPLGESSMQIDIETEQRITVGSWNSER